MGISATRQIYSADFDSVYVSGDNRDTENLSIARFANPNPWKDILSGDYGLCDGCVLIMGPNIAIKLSLSNVI